MKQDYEYVFRRRHPHCRANREIWEKSRAAFSGGGDYIRRALVKHVSEVDLEFQERLHRGYYFNYPRKIARLITQYVLSVEPQRENVDPAAAEDFSRGGLRVSEVMRQFSTLLNVYGSAALVVEMPFFEGEVDHERKRREKIRPGVRAVSPLEIADWAYGPDGRLEWLLLEEEDRLDGGPFLPAVPVLRRKLWTRREHYVFEKDSVTGLTALLSRGEHGLDQVPAVYCLEPENHALAANHYFEDVVRISDAILNNESEAQMNIVKQLFGLLVISDSFARGARKSDGGGGGAETRFSHVLARSAAIWETPEEKGVSRFISPSGADSETIQQTNLVLKKELFDVVGMALSPELHMAQTAEAKAWDNHNVRQFLASRVDILEQAEARAWELMHAFDPAIPVPRVVYNRDFSVVDLQNSIASLLELKRVSGGAEYRREIARTALFLLEKIRRIAPERQRAILQEIDRWQQSAREEAADA